MSAISKEQVLKALDTIIIPKLGKPLTEADVVENVSVEDGSVKIRLRFNIAAYASKSQLKAWVTDAIGSQPGVRKLETEFITGPNNPRQQPKAAPLALQFPQVRCVFVVFSGKGGVGKSTVSVNLATALTILGRRVGLFDADMHGPSVPALMGIDDRPRMEEGKMLPLQRHGVKTMSVGYLVEKDAPLIWRGPMITKGINELLEGTDWGELDFLILDLPPGTGDAQLGLAQDVRLDGAIAVTTPQQVALSDVRRGIEAFKKLEVPLWGVIENMAYFVCPECGKQTEVFGPRKHLNGGWEVLGHLPLDPLLCEAGERGVPLVAAQPKHPASLEIRRVSETIIERAG